MPEPLEIHEIGFVACLIVGLPLVALALRWLADKEGQRGDDA